MPHLHQVKPGSWSQVTVELDDGSILHRDEKPAVFTLQEARRIACDPDQLKVWLTDHHQSRHMPKGKEKP